MDGDSHPSLALPSILLQVVFHPPTSQVFLASATILLLLIVSALMSASEIAYFSLTKYEIDDLQNTRDATDRRIAMLMQQPRYLLSTILVSNNVVNIGIVIFMHYVISSLCSFSDWHWQQFSVSAELLELLANVLVDTFVLVLFAEALPKVYAAHNKMLMARAMSSVMVALMRVYTPVNFLLVGSTRAIEQKLKRHNREIDIEEINKAIEITVDPKDSGQNARMLKGIVHFGNITVKQVMKPRVEIAAVEQSINFSELMKQVREYGYSRLPVYNENLDNPVGVLHIKDLIEHLDKPADFDWNGLVREALFVPETKKIDDLLREIQESRKHLAIVVDEYGGTAGIITLEDIMEEVVGDIRDEFDEVADADYKQIDERTFLFDGKILLVDAVKILNVESAVFDEVKGESETVAGLLLEVIGRIPRENDEVYINEFLFRILSVKNHRIEKVKVTKP